MTFKKFFIFLTITICGFESFSYGMDKVASEINLPHYTQKQVSEIVVNTGIDTYKKINNHWSYADSTKSIAFNDKIWTIERRPTSCVYTYNLNSNANKIVEDFDTLLTNPFQTECMLAVRAVQIACLIKLIGNDNFKLLTDEYLNLVKCVRLFVSKKPKESGIEIGDFVSLKNINAYKYLKPKGNHSGQNILCIGENQFIGFDKEFFEDPKSEAEIVEDFYNNVRSTDHLDSRLGGEHKKFFDSVVTDLASFKETRENEENHLPANIEFFDVQKINNFLQKLLK